jgi:hypothetical protein
VPAQRKQFGQNTILARFGRRSPGESIGEIMSELPQEGRIISPDEHSFQSPSETPEIPAQLLQLLKEHFDSNRSELAEDRLKISFIPPPDSPKSFHFLRPYLPFPHESTLSWHYPKTIET